MPVWQPSGIAGKPSQWLLIQDPLVAGGDDVAWATSEFGPKVGITEPDADNVGAMIPSVLPDPAPDADTASAITLQVLQGGPLGHRRGGLGSAEWAYLPGLVDDTSRTAEWRGYHSELYEWGHHGPFNGSAGPGGAIILYSTLYRRVLLCAIVTNGDFVSILSTNNSDAGDLPTNEDDWDQLATITPADGGPSTYEHGLAGCELRDGTLLLAVRKKYLVNAGPDITTRGDWDLYRSLDGGETWVCTQRDFFMRNAMGSADPEDRTTVRLACSGSWVRLCYVENGGAIGTFVSSDNGVTWEFLADLITTITLKTDQTNDKLTYDLVGLDDQTGTFLIAGGPTASKSVQFWVADRGNGWSAQTLVSITGQPTPRAIFWLRDPYWLNLYVRTHTPGSASNSWLLYRVKRDHALVAAAWESPIANWAEWEGADRLCPIQVRATWCGDKAGVICHLQDVGDSSPYNHVNNRPVLWWVGGWSVRPIGNDYAIFDGAAEVVRWTYDFGEPKGGATSSTMSRWIQSLASGGTHSWSPDGMLVESFGAGDSAYHELRWDAPDDSTAPPQWDAADADEENYWRTVKPYAMEWVMSAGNTAPTGGNYIVTRVTMPSAQLSPAGWRITLRHSTTGIIAWDQYGSSPLATLSVDLTTLDEGTSHRVRFCVSPAASPSNPTAVLMHRREDGDTWTTVGPFTLGPPSGSATATQTAILFGHLTHVGSNTISSRWREMRIFQRRMRTDYGAADGWTAPDDLLGARASGRPRSLGSGTTEADALRLAVAWGGAGGAMGDRYTHELAHTGAAELAGGWRSPAKGWLSVAGATASSSYVAWDAGGGARSRTFEAQADTGGRFVHSHAAIFGLRGATGRVEYSDTADFASVTIAGTYSSIFATGVTLASANGYRLGISAAGLTAIGRSSLAGKLIGCTAGAVSGRIWRIRRHEYDALRSIHYVELDPDGQFSPVGIAVGQSFALASDRVWLDYGQTIRARYVRVTGGLSTTNTWDGRWGVGLFVPGLAWEIDPPMDWSHSDEDRARTKRFETRSGESWARKEGEAQRSITGRLIGDDREALYELRGLLRSVAEHHVAPMALLRDSERVKGQGDSLLPVEWVGDSIIDVQAYGRDEADIIRRFGDEMITLRELV